MARPSRTGGKTSEAKARNASPAKGRKTTKTKPRIAPAATRVKRRSVSGPSKDLKEAREQQAATAEILKVIASSPSDVQPVFEAIAASANRLIGGFSAAVYRVCRRASFIWRRSRRPIRPRRGFEGILPAARSPKCRHFQLVENGEIVADLGHRNEPTAADAKWREPAAFAACCITR